MYERNGRPNSNNNQGRSNRPGHDRTKPYGQGVGQNRAQPAPEIHPMQVPDDYVDEAERVMRGLARSITTSKIRNLLSFASEIYNVENLRSDEILLPESVARLMLMRVRVLYEAGRDDSTRGFIERTHLLEYIKGIGDRRENLIRFARYMEALVAYHRYFGGREG